MNIFKVTVIATIFLAMDSSAGMIDDFEDGDYQNEAGFSWFYTIVHCENEVTIKNAVQDEYGMWGMLPVAGIGHDEGYAGELTWKFGGKPSGCTHERLVSLVASLWFDSQGGGIEWYKATEISFYAKATATITVRVQFVLSGEPMTLFNKEIEIAREWTRYTVPFSELVLDESSVPAEFRSYSVRKIQFAVLESFPGTPDSGTLIIDDLEVNDTVISYFTQVLAVESSEPGKSGELHGTLLADFEEEGQGGDGPEISKFKTSWYLIDDWGMAGARNSIFTDGIQTDPGDSARTLHLDSGNTDGFDGTRGMKVSFKLGNPIRNGGEVTQPFIGIGCMLSNSDRYSSGADTTLKTADLSEATGLYFDYKTVCTSEKFRHFDFEFYDTDNLPEGNSFHKEIPATRGVWRSAVVPFADLDRPRNFDSLTAEQRSLDMRKADRILFRFRNVKTTEIDAFFDNVTFVGNACAPSGCGEHVVSSIDRKSASIRFLKSARGLKITLDALPGGTHDGAVELIGISGVTVAKKRIRAHGSHSIFIPTGEISTGVYILRVITRYGNGEKHAFSRRISVCN